MGLGLGDGRYEPRPVWTSRTFTSSFHRLLFIYLSRQCEGPFGSVTHTCHVEGMGAGGSLERGGLSKRRRSSKSFFCGLACYL